ncbi:MAG: hypothetical protein A2Y10_14060 [Planctomycetes bacterium GWF2_41_51]|nr:MAG: hypothetical protein A2Y10_14060 [Planctomycetes bacterium GWF2_41_51]
MSNFTWLPFFEEMLNVICTKYDKKSLCEVFHKIFSDSGGREDFLADDTKGLLREIDPLTFIAFFNRNNTLENRLRYCSKAKAVLALNSFVPTDLIGTPSINAQLTWFFGWEKDRKPEYMENLWSFSKRLDNDTITSELFYNVLQIPNVGVAKLTTVMFICKPQKYFSLDGTNLSFLKNKEIETKEFLRQINLSEGFEDYQGLLECLRDKFADKKFYEISYDAYKYRIDNEQEEESHFGDGIAEKKPNYWAISPGVQAGLWEMWKKDGIATIGWDEIGDLTQYKTKKEIKEAIKKEYKPTQEPTNNTKTCYDFAFMLKEGDIVLAKKGNSLILGIGEVVGPYTFEKNSYEHFHRRKVKWMQTAEWSVPTNEWDKTLTEITNSPLLSKYLQIIKYTGGQNKIKYTKSDALAQLFIDEEEFNNIIDALKYKKNIVLQGPPGVGKTFIAKRLAYTLIGYKDKTKVEMIQFHQSYSYEDFIQGYRPNDDGKFDLKNGVFFRFCKKAREDLGNKYVFIIDEINRGNLSKIFGELMMLIENDKRGEKYEMPLAYAKTSDEKFHIPPNLYLIGTMNTADRSLAMVDYALRRRFCFINLFPMFKTEGFKNCLIDGKLSAELIQVIISKMTNLNKSISENKINLGSDYQIGHSYFCPNGEKRIYDESWYKMIINHEIKPLLEAYWFDDLDKAKTEVTKLLNLEQ